MNLAKGRINFKQSRISGFAIDEFHKSLKQAAGAPFSEFVINAIPVAVAGRQVAPACSAFEDPQALKTVRGLSDGRPTFDDFSNTNFVLAHCASVKSLW